MQQEVRQSWHFNQSPKEVWDYLTKPELLEQWLVTRNFQPIVGNKFHIIGDCNDEGSEVAHCEVLEVKPYTQLAYSWQTNSAVDNKPFNSKVMWTLISKDNGTELQLVHNGFKSMEDVNAHNDGWTRCGNKMVEILSEVAK